MLDNGEGWLYRCDNILTEPDAEKIHWELLPDGEHGIRKAEFGSVQEEHNLVPLGDDRLYWSTARRPATLPHLQRRRRPHLDQAGAR